MTDGRITINQVDSGRNRGVGDGNPGDDDIDMLDEGFEDGRHVSEPDLVDRGLQSSSKKKRAAKRG